MYWFVDWEDGFVGRLISRRMCCRLQSQHLKWVVLFGERQGEYNWYWGGVWQLPGTGS